MKQYDFKPTWKKNIPSPKKLSEVLGIPEKDLLTISSHADKHYRKLETPKRTFLIPSKPLKKIQRAILKNFFDMTFDSCVQGGVRGRSIATNARKHLGQKWVTCLDIKKFFPNCHHTNIMKIYLGLGCSEDVAKIMTHLTTHEYQLPQGSPTSPLLSNLILHDLDKRISSLCKTMGWNYSRYFDDMVISGKRSPASYVPTIKKIVENYGQRLHPQSNTKKIRIQPDTGIQSITGIVVNDSKLSMSPELLEKLDKSIKDGLAGNFSDDYYFNPEKTKESTKGYIDFLNSLNRKQAKAYLTDFKKIKWPHENQLATN